MPFSAWYIRLAAVVFILTVDHAAPVLAILLVLGAGVSAIAGTMYEARQLPGFLMDILNRLTDRDALERAMANRARKPRVIDAEALALRVMSKVVGQDKSIRRIALQLRRRYASRRPDKPIAVFCLAGPPGTGKTWLAKVLAGELFKDPTHLHFFDMSQFGQAHAASTLFGSAKGYVGSSSYGQLTAALRDRGEALVLLDEFEKAHPEVHRRFLTAWNDGFVTEASDGAKVPTSEAIFILTTNAASGRLADLARDFIGEDDEFDRLAKAALKDANFAPELLSRIDEVFVFRDLEGLDIARVVALEIEKLVRQFDLEVEGGGIEAEVLLDAVEALQARMHGGARDIARAIERQISDGLIDARASGAKLVRIVKNVDRVAVAAVTGTSPADMTRPVSEDEDVPR